MVITDKLVKQITETKYLSTENSYRYRAILRYFFEEYEKIRYWIYKEDIFGELKKNELFADYTIEQCVQDLDTLEKWGNIIAVQDTGKVTSIEAFKNRQFRYEITQTGIEIERLTVKLENLSIEGSSLEPSLLERFKVSLKQYKDIIDKDYKQVGAWWNSLYNDFKLLNENYKSYIKKIYNIKSDELIKIDRFIVFKDELIKYLREFVKGLLINISEIETILLQITAEDKQNLLNKVYEYEIKIPRIEAVENSQIYENIYSKWQILSDWFLNTPNSQSEATKLFEKTNSVIRKLTRYAVQISERLNSSINKKDEYKKICTMFLSCDTIDDANCLSAHVFGIESMKHIQTDEIRITDSINSSVFDEPPINVNINPRSKTIKEKIEHSAIKDKTEQKQKELQKTLEQRQKENELINQYIINGYLCFENLTNISAFVRQVFLKWLSNAIVDSSYSGRTETGENYTLINPHETEVCIINCEDGIFKMPKYKLKFGSDTSEKK